MEIIKDINLLKVISRPVTKNDMLGDLITGMQDILKEHRAVGLSAIQVGQPLRLFVIQIGFHKFEVFQNPELYDLDGRMMFPNEMCLSFPGDKINTIRYRVCKIKDEMHPEPISCGGIMSIAVQHEMDHLDGIVMSDREYKIVSVGRNEPCPCKSGKKYKKCCGLMGGV